MDVKTRGFRDTGRNPTAFLLVVDIPARFNFFFGRFAFLLLCAALFLGPGSSQLVHAQSGDEIEIVSEYTLEQGFWTKEDFISSSSRKFSDLAIAEAAMRNWQGGHPRWQTMALDSVTEDGEGAKVYNYKPSNNQVPLSGKEYTDIYTHDRFVASYESEEEALLGSAIHNDCEYIENEFVLGEDTDVFDWFNDDANPYDLGGERFRKRILYQFTWRGCDGGNRIERTTVYHNGTYTCPEGWEVAPRDGEITTVDEDAVCENLAAASIRQVNYERQIPDEEKGEPDPCSETGNPCDVGTGNKFQSEIDIDIPVLTLTRNYNSRETDDTGFGVGWTSPFHRRLYIHENPEESFIVRGEDGSEEVVFRKGLEPDSDYDSVLVGSTSIIVVGEDTSEDRFDSATGLLLTAEDQHGNETVYSYNENDELESVVGLYGHSLTFVYENGHVSKVTDSQSNSYSYEYDSDDNLVRVTYPGGASRQYHYEDVNCPNALTGITDGNGDRYATYSYDEQCRATGSEHAETDNGAPQEKIHIDYLSDTEAMVTDAAGSSWHYRFEKILGEKRLVERTSNLDGMGITRTYDSNGNLLTHTDPEGRINTYEYDSYNQLIREDIADNTPAQMVRRYQYRDAGGVGNGGSEDLVTEIRRSGNYFSTYVTTLTYNSKRAVSSITQRFRKPDLSAYVERVTNFQHDDYGKITKIDGPLDNATHSDVFTITYYDCDLGAECGRKQSFTDASGTVTFDEYDENGRLTKMTGKNGLVTTFAYHPRGWIESVTETPPAGQGNPRTTEYIYDDAGQTVEARFPGGEVLQYSYDAAHYLKNISDQLGNKISYRYDLKGNLTATSVEDSNGVLAALVERAYDFRDQVASTTTGTPGSTTIFIRDAVGNETVRTAPNGSTVTTTSYDSRNRPSVVTDALGGVSMFEYYKSGHPSSVQAPNGATTTFLYDELGNLHEENSPDRGVTSFDYDVAGNLIQRTDARGIATLYEYDALSRVTAIAYPDPALTEHFDYDFCAFGNGRLCSIYDESGHTEFEYDRYGNVASKGFLPNVEIGSMEGNEDDEQTFFTRYAYDQRDRLTRIEYPFGGAVDIQRDSVGRVSAMDFELDGDAIPIVRERTYRPDNLPTTHTLGNGLEVTKQYDTQGRLVAQTLGGVDTRQYAYNPNGNIVQRQHATTDGVNTATFSYDLLDRLTDELNSLTGNFVATYGANSNRLSRTWNGRTKSYSYSPDSNRLVQANGKDVVLDEMGNTLSDRNGKRVFTYNDAGRLRSVTKKAN